MQRILVAGVTGAGKSTLARGGYAPGDPVPRNGRAVFLGTELDGKLAPLRTLRFTDPRAAAGWLRTLAGT
ncbi:hypothetical protein [Streptomyces sp. HUAS TT7]|uniref:hypothetical protein n=1 Tax=Streptomyces sp. HUAS TT7 TaxID=3447507 RepID=UPI003F65BA07